MLSRNSQVQKLQVKSVIIASFLEIGDSHIINSLSRAIAIQREQEIFFGTEIDYSQYSIFSEIIPTPPIEEDIIMQSMNLSPMIRVGHIDVIGVSSGSGIHIGSSDHISMEARIKHIRQLENVEAEEAAQLPR